MAIVFHAYASPPFLICQEERISSDEMSNYIERGAFFHNKFIEMKIKVKFTGGLTLTNWNYSNALIAHINMALDKFGMCEIQRSIH